MQTVSAGAVADGVIRARDWDPETFTLTGAARQLFTEAANDALRTAWGRQKWPQLMRIEPRRFRPDWSAATAYTAGQEVWHAATEAYWKCLVEHGRDAGRGRHVLGAAGGVHSVHPAGSAVGGVSDR